MDGALDILTGGGGESITGQACVLTLKNYLCFYFFKVQEISPPNQPSLISIVSLSKFRGVNFVIGSHITNGIM